MVYDLSSIPVKVATIARETHVRGEDGSINPESKLQYSFEYTGGMGNPVLKKVQAEKGKAIRFENGNSIEVDADPRWVGNGRAILNNKGKPVKQYEPYFSSTHYYEDEPSLREGGVTPVLHYDAMGRLVRTGHPDGTVSRVEFDGWLQKTFDQNDTLADIDCNWRLKRENPDATFINKLQVYGGTIDKEKEALAKSLIHANTPSIVLTDSLGRPFYTIDHNKWQFRNQVNPQPPPIEEFSTTRIVMDIEGNTLQIIDARNNIVMKYDYDMLGNTAHSVSMDAGDRWVLNDSMGKPTWAWDSKEQRFESNYDILHRPVESRLLKNNQVFIFERIIYGTDKLQNLNGVAVAHFDTAGVIRITAADFKGSVTKSSRQLCTLSTGIPDWNDLSSEIFTTSSAFDALGRIVEMISPHNENDPLQKPSIFKPVYNEASLLQQVSVSLRAGPDKIFVSNIDYDSKGRRTRITYGNNSFTKYQYDPETFRLRRLITCPDGVTNRDHFHNDDELKKTAFQFLSYTYDPVGNIINIEDEAQQTYYFSNSQIKPENNYQYDALYRLVEAKGREHIGQNLPPNAYDKNRMFSDNIPAADNALRNYIQRYSYDVVGNMTEMAHTVKDLPGSTGWTRKFSHAANSNQLVSSFIGNNIERYTYDAHGNMEKLPHLPGIVWNFRDQVQHLLIQASSENENADGASYCYDGAGERIRKLVTKGNITEECIYLGGFEIFRKWQNNSKVTERESLHIMDDKNRIAMVETLIIENGVQLAVEETLIRYQYSNHLGSAFLEVDDAARVISYEEYHPYGTTAYQNQNKNVTTAAKRYRYIGMERDEESGMGYHSARYYLPWLGRWLSSDPAGMIDGHNLYVYAHANPISMKDTGGLEADPTDENQRPVNIQKLISEKPEIVAELLRETTLSRSEKEINRPAIDKSGKLEKGTSGEIIPHYTPYRVIKIEYSGKDSKVAFHCTDFIYNLSFQSGFDPPKGVPGYWMKTTNVLKQLKALEKMGVIDIVQTPKDNPKTSIDESTENIRGGDILVWGAQPGGEFGHHMLITGIRQSEKSTVNTREAGASVLPDNTAELFKNNIPSAVYRLKRFDREKVTELYTGNSDFRKAFDTAFARKEKETESYNRLITDMSTRHGNFPPLQPSLNIYRLKKK
jgi:RHS repeat-associated protein